MEKEQDKEPVSAMERERTMRNLVDMQRKVEQRQQRDKERQLLRVRESRTEKPILLIRILGSLWEVVVKRYSDSICFCQIQERLSIIQSRKAEEDLLGLKHTDRLKHLTQDLPQARTCLGNLSE